MLDIHCECVSRSLFQSWILHCKAPSWTVIPGSEPRIHHSTIWLLYHEKKQQMAHEYASTLFVQVASSNLLHIDYFNTLVKSLVRGDKRLSSLLLIWPFRQTTKPQPAFGPCGRHQVQCLTGDQKPQSSAEVAHSSTCITNNLT